MAAFILVAGVVSFAGLSSRRLTLGSPRAWTFALSVLHTPASEGSVASWSSKSCLCADATVRPGRLPRVPGSSSHLPRGPSAWMSDRCRELGTSQTELLTFLPRPVPPTAFTVRRLACPAFRDLGVRLDLPLFPHLHQFYQPILLAVPSKHIPSQAVLTLPPLFLSWAKSSLIWDYAEGAWGTAGDAHLLSPPVPHPCPQLHSILHAQPGTLLQ